MSDCECEYFEEFSVNEALRHADTSLRWSIAASNPVVKKRLEDLTKSHLDALAKNAPSFMPDFVSIINKVKDKIVKDPVGAYSDLGALMVDYEKAVRAAFARCARECAGGKEKK